VVSRRFESRQPVTVKTAAKVAQIYWHTNVVVEEPSTFVQQRLLLLAKSVNCRNCRRRIYDGNALLFIVLMVVEPMSAAVSFLRSVYVSCKTQSHVLIIYLIVLWRPLFSFTAAWHLFFFIL